MSVCQELTVKHSAMRTRRGGTIEWTEPCGMATNEHGFCPFHDGPLCPDCGLPLPGRRLFRGESTVAHNGCKTHAPLPSPPPMGVDGENATILWHDRERARLGGERGIRFERVMKDAAPREEEWR